MGTIIFCCKRACKCTHQSSDTASKKSLHPRFPSPSIQNEQASPMAWWRRPWTLRNHVDISESTVDNNLPLFFSYTTPPWLVEQNAYWKDIVYYRVNVYYSLLRCILSTFQFMSSIDWFGSLLTSLLIRNVSAAVALFARDSNNKTIFETDQLGHVGHPHACIDGPTDR